MEKRCYMLRKEGGGGGGSRNLCDSVVRRRYIGGGARDTRREPRLCGAKGAPYLLSLSAL
jgi:hypothetical protein